MKETNISYKHHEKMVVGFSDYSATMKAWERDFPEYITEIEKGGYELKVPIHLFKSSTTLKRKVNVLTDEQKQAARERLAAMRTK